MTVRWSTTTARRFVAALDDGDCGQFVGALRFFLDHPTDGHRSILEAAFDLVPPARRVDMRIAVARAALSEAEETAAEPETPFMDELEEEAER